MALRFDDHVKEEEREDRLLEISFIVPVSSRRQGIELGGELLKDLEETAEQRNFRIIASTMNLDDDARSELDETP